MAHLQRHNAVVMKDGGRKWMTLDGKMAVVVSAVPDEHPLVAIPLPADSPRVDIKAELVSTITDFVVGYPGKVICKGGIKPNLPDYSIEDKGAEDKAEKVVKGMIDGGGERGSVSVNGKLLKILLDAMPAGMLDVIRVSVYEEAIVLYTSGSAVDGYEAVGLLMGMKDVIEHNPEAFRQAMARMLTPEDDEKERDVNVEHR